MMASALLSQSIMKSSRIHRLTGRLAAGLSSFMCVYLLAACSPNGGSAPSSGMQVPGVRYQADRQGPTLELTSSPGQSTFPNLVTQTTSTQPQGTGDLGGGDGLDGKLFEAYTFDVQLDEDYRKILQPIDLHLISLWPDDPKTPERESMPFLSFAAAMKHWYIAPVQLNKIDKTSLGINFVMDPVQQMALQNTREVWIDKALLPKTPTERARLYLHELVMSFYMLQFEDLENLCKTMKAGTQCGDGQSKSDTNEGIDTSAIENFMRAFIAPKPRRALDANDYANVRAVTDFLFTRSKELKTYNEMKALFINKGFDGRLFGEYNMPVFDNNEEFRAIRKEKMETGRVEQGLRLAQKMRELSISGHGPKFCRYDDIGNAQARCELEVGKPLSLANGQTVVPLKLVIKDLKGNILQTIKTRIFAEKEMTLGEVSLAGGFKSSNVYSYMVGKSLAEGENGTIQTEPRDGDRIWVLTAYLISPYQDGVFGFEIRPYLVTEVRSGSYGLVSSTTPTFDKLTTELLLKQENISGLPAINMQYPGIISTTPKKLDEQRTALCLIDKNCTQSPE